MPRRLLAAGLLVWLLAGCMQQYTPRQLAATAATQGCWPYGHAQPPPTRTPLPTTTATTGPGTPTLPPLTPTPGPSQTPVPTWPACTPLPLTPTLTPSPTASPTPWTQPTMQPGTLSDVPPTNLSHQPGTDTAPALAVHPTAGWAAVVWAQWLPEYPDEATIWVRVQHPTTGGWQPAQGVNTGQVREHGGEPAITIDHDGRIHVAFTQDGVPVVTTSPDDGATWDTPTPVPVAGTATALAQLHSDAEGQLHLLLMVQDGCDDCLQYVHAVRPAAGGSWALSWPFPSAGKQLRGDIATVRLADGTLRTVVAVGCRAEGGGCAPGVLVATRDGGGAWRPRLIPGQSQPIPAQVVNWVDVLATTATDGTQLVCVAWGQYSASGVFASCSHDGGATFEPQGVIAFHAVAANEDEPDWDTTDRGYRPELVYSPAADRLVAVWLLREAAPADTSENPAYLVWSWRDRTQPTWWPRIEDPLIEPALRLVATTRRSAARDLRVAVGPTGLAWVAWTEAERDESAEVYVAAWYPAARVMEE